MQNGENRLALLSTPKLHGTVRIQRRQRIESSNRPATATNPTSRYWRAAGQVRDDELWIGNPPRVGSCTDPKVSNGGTSYESRLNELTASAGAKGPPQGTSNLDSSPSLNVAKRKTSVTLRHRPNSSEVYSKIGATGHRRNESEGQFAMKPQVSQQMPVFQQPDTTKSVTLSNQRDEEAGVRSSGLGLARKISTDYSQAALSAAPHPGMMRSESESGTRTQVGPFGGYEGSTTSKLTGPSNNSIEIYEPVKRTRSNSGEQFSVSPITVQHLAIDDKAKRGSSSLLTAVHNNAWGLHKQYNDQIPPDRMLGRSTESSTTDVSPIGSSTVTYAGQTEALPLLSCPSGNSTKHKSISDGKADATASKDHSESSAESAEKQIGSANGLFALRGSSFTPLPLFSQTLDCADKSCSTISVNNVLNTENISPAVDDTQPSPPSPFMRCVTSPLVERKSLFTRNVSKQQKHQAFKPNTDWNPVEIKPILKKSGMSYTKKMVTFDLSENMYSEHVPYVSPPKFTSDVVESRGNALAASMRIPLVATPMADAPYIYQGVCGTASDTSRNSSSASAYTDMISRGGGLSFKHRNSILSYKGGYENSA